MNNRTLRSAIALSLGALLAFAGTVAADTARADGDVASPTIETVALPDPFAPGEVRSIDIGIVLTCSGSTHVDPGQTVTAAIDFSNAPLDGSVISVTDGTVGPAPADWTPDGVSCPSPAPMFYAGTPSVVTLRAPTTPGTGYVYSLMYHRSIEPFGANDPGGHRLTGVQVGGAGAGQDDADIHRSHLTGRERVEVRGRFDGERGDIAIGARGVGRDGSGEGQEGTEG